MARTVKNFPTPKRGRPIKYDYKTWFSGKKVELQEGVDFDVDAASMKAAIYAAKNRMGMTVRTTTEVRDGVTFITVQRLTGAVAARYNAGNKGRGRKPKAKVAA